MSRLGSNEIIVKPSNNVYTVLAVVGALAVAIGLLALFTQAKALGVSFR